MLYLLAIVAVAASVINGQDDLTWVFPTSRGPTGNGSTTAPCGGYDPSTTRASYPLTGTNIIFNTSTLLANINIMHINQTNPTRFHGFSTYTESILAMSTGQYCAPGPDFSTINGYAVGNDATLLIIYQNYNGNASSYEYTCADVTLVEASSFTAVDAVCSNSSAIIDVSPLDQSLRLSGSNYTDAQTGQDGQQIVIANTPASTVASATVVTITDATTAAATDAHGRTTSGSAAATSAVSASGAASSGAAASTSAASSAGKSIQAVGSFVAVVGLLVVTLV